MLRYINHNYETPNKAKICLWTHGYDDKDDATICVMLDTPEDAEEPEDAKEPGDTEEDLGVAEHLYRTVTSGPYD